MSYKIKKNINNYIDIILEIMKNKNLFEESLSFKMDENNENIISVTINYFEQKLVLNNSNSSNKNHKNFSSNLYYIINLLKKEQLYYNAIIKSIGDIDIVKNIPIFILYKYYLFFDIICGRHVPDNISDKLYSFISNNKNIYNSNKITKSIYNCLMERYKEQNNKINSTFYAIYEYKRELTIKYFSEECAMRLRYKQKDIINKKIDELMPKEFGISHQNLIKKILIEDQLKYFFLNKSYLFDASNTILYSIVPKGILTYNLSKNIAIISENTFK